MRAAVGSAWALVGLATLVGGCRAERDSGERVARRSAPITVGAGIELVPPTLSPVAGFGRFVSVSGDRAVVAALDDEVGGVSTGTANVFVRSGGTWTFEARLEPPTLANGIDFGSSVAIDGDVAVVGARFQDSQRGAAYIYERTGSTWDMTGSIEVPTAPLGTWLGWDVAVSGARVAAAAPALLAESFVLVYAKTGTDWSLEQKLVPSDVKVGDRFGFSIDLYGDTLIAGTPFFDLPDGDGGVVDDGGKAYVYRRAGTTWSIEAELIRGAIVGPSEEFGAVVALDRDLAAIGSRPAPDVGVAHLWTRTGTTWTKQTQLVSPARAVDPTVRDQFAWSLDVSDRTLVIGAADFDKQGGPGQDNTGIAYAYVLESGGWSMPTSFEAPGAAQLEFFAFGVAVDQDTIVAGAHGRDDGVAFAFDLPLVENGQACDPDLPCASEICVEGVCCDSPCDGLCESCLQSNTTAPDGTCSPVADGTDPDDDCAAGSPMSCGPDGHCDGTGACRPFAPPGAACGPTVCVDGEQSGPACNGNGECESAVLAECDPYVCDAAGTECLDACGSDADCVGEASCNVVGQCSAKALQGEDCNAADECLTGFCADGVCCDAACDGDCETCDLEATAGICSAVTAAEPACAPYRCAPRQCKTACASSADCVDGFVCDIAAKECVTASTDDTPPDEGGCGCRVRSRQTSAPALLAVLLALMARRRRRA